VTAHYPTLLRTTVGLARGINKSHEITSGENLPHNPEETKDQPDSLAHLRTLHYAHPVYRSEVSMFPFRLPELGRAFQGDCHYILRNASRKKLYEHTRSTRSETILAYSLHVWR
jgi:hypothetical protein